MITKRRLSAALIVVLLVAAAPGVAAAEEQFGASISPAPLIVEDWRDPAFNLVNSGTVAVSIILELSGDSDYRLEETRFDLGPGESASVPVAAIGEGEATVKVHVTNSAPGMDRQALVLETRIRHLTPWERVPWALVAAVLAVAAVVVILGARLYVGKRRRQVRRQAARPMA